VLISFSIGGCRASQGDENHEEHENGHILHVVFLEEIDLKLNVGAEI
jgi:hypothetical protein